MLTPNDAHIVQPADSPSPYTRARSGASRHITHTQTPIRCSAHAVTVATAVHNIQTATFVGVRPVHCYNIFVSPTSSNRDFDCIRRVSVSELFLFVSLPMWELSCLLDEKIDYILLQVYIAWSLSMCLIIFPTISMKTEWEQIWLRKEKIEKRTKRKGGKFCFVTCHRLCMGHICLCLWS